MMQVTPNKIVNNNNNTMARLSTTLQSLCYKRPFGIFCMPKNGYIVKIKYVFLLSLFLNDVELNDGTFFFFFTQYENTTQHSRVNCSDPTSDIINSIK